MTIAYIPGAWHIVKAGSILTNERMNEVTLKPGATVQGLCLQWPVPPGTASTLWIVEPQNDRAAGVLQGPALLFRMSSVKSAEPLLTGSCHQLSRSRQAAGRLEGRVRAWRAGTGSYLALWV